MRGKVEKFFFFFFFFFIVIIRRLGIASQQRCRLPSERETKWGLSSIAARRDRAERFGGGGGGGVDGMVIESVRRSMVDGLGARGHECGGWEPIEMNGGDGEEIVLTTMAGYRRSGRSELNRIGRWLG